MANNRSVEILTSYFLHLTSKWRKRWDLNPRYVAVQLISSQSRYDCFDMLPCKKINNNMIHVKKLFIK